jgi:hypothetical protein
VDSLCTYNQHDLSTSKLTFLARVLDDYHISVVGYVDFGGLVDVVGACSVYFVLIAYVFSVGAIFIFCRTSCYTFFYFTGGLRATCLPKISSSVSFPSSMLMYSICSIAGVYSIAAGGAAVVCTFCVFSCPVFCSSRTARVHMDSPSKSSTSFRRLLCLSMVFASSWSDGDLSTPFILRWCLAPRAA